MPLIYTKSIYPFLFGLLFCLWASSEFLGPVRWGRLRQGKKRDKGSILVGAIVGPIGIALALGFPLLFPWANMIQPTAFFIGVALMLAGACWRWWAIITLGRFFTATVLIQEDQEIVQRGPYRWIRHPSYSGVLLIMAGFGCMIGNWISLFFIVAGLLLPLLYRISIEEQELLKVFEQYGEYMKHTKRLIPFLF